MLDRSSDSLIDEDTGLDGLHDDEEPGFDPDLNPDPNGDDYHFVTGSTDYSKINNPERNSVDDPNGRPDTEDLNLDGNLNTQNDYFEATIDLSDTTNVAIDVARDYPGNPDVKPENGWRLFRIALDSPAFQAFALAYQNLESGDSVFAFKAFSDNGNGAGYTQYRDIRFYVHGDPGVEAQKLRVLARFGADTINYYEYSLPVRSGWQDVRVPMETLSRLK